MNCLSRSGICFIFILIACHAHSQVVPLSRITNWSLAGLHGDIPTYEKLVNITVYGGSGNGATINDVALQKAIASLAGQNGIIYFPAGTYLFNASIALRSGLVLRGEGAANTILQFNPGGANHLVTFEGQSYDSFTNIISSVYKNESSVAVDAASSFEVNDYLEIYQNDSKLVFDQSALGSVGQVIRVDSLSGHFVFFSSPLRRNYLLADSPKLRRLKMLTGAGMECLKIKRMDAAAPLKSNIFFFNAAKCWVKGVESDSCNFAHVRIDNSTNIEITNCYFHGAFSYGATGEGYGIVCQYATGECLVENNIFRHLRHSMLVQYGANGNVFDYNYSIAPFKSESTPNDLSGDIVLHGNYPYLNLFEGNIAQNIFIDAAHGKNGPYNTLFRNRAESYGIIISAGGGDSTNIVGNEINGSGFGKGNYLPQGSGNFEYANNRNNTIYPAGSTTLPDKSYIYDSMPAFWNIDSPWPPMGSPMPLGAGTIPAKERYLAGNELSYCLQGAGVVYTFTGNGNWDVATNWSDNKIPPAMLSNGSKIIIDPPAGGQCILNIPYTINPGTQLIVAAGKSFFINNNLILQK